MDGAAQGVQVGRDPLRNPLPQTETRVLTFSPVLPGPDVTERHRRIVSSLCFDLEKARALGLPDRDPASDHVSGDRCVKAQVHGVEMNETARNPRMQRVFQSRERPLLFEGNPMHDYRKQIRERRRVEGEEPGLLDSGFTLIELLVIIVVLGILAAVVIYALSGVTASSAQSACNADAKTVEVAIADYNNQHGGWPLNSASLTSGPTVYLRTWPSNSAYTITMDTQGNVYVNSGNYDNAATNPCGQVS